MFKYNLKKIDIKKNITISYEYIIIRFFRYSKEIR